MSRIFFIRHGQASFLKANYDQLSDLGHEQARELGRYFRTRKIMPDQIYAGELKRQNETAHSLMETMDLTHPVIRHHGLDEHHGFRLVKSFFPERFHIEKPVSTEDFETKRRSFYGTYFELAISWVRGELDREKTGQFEDWLSFRERFRNAMTHIMENCPKSSNVFIFTSGGPVGASMGEVLSLDDEKTLQLGWQVRNTAITEFLYSSGRISLVSFNEIPHLKDPQLITMV